MSDQPISVKDEDVLITPNVVSFNFTGPGVQTCVDGDGNVEVKIEGCDGGGLVIQDEGLEVALDPETINFVGLGVNATQTAPGVVTVTIDNSGTGPGGSGLTVRDEGVLATPSARSMNFIGSGVTTSADVNGNVTVNVPGGSGGGDPGGIGGDPLGAAQFPVGTFAYMDSRAPTPPNFEEITDTELLTAASYPELAQVIPPKAGYQDNAVDQVIFVESIRYDFSGLATAGGGYYFVAVFDLTTTPRTPGVLVYQEIEGVYTLQTFIPIELQQPQDPFTLPSVTSWSMAYTGTYLIIVEPTKQFFRFGLNPELVNGVAHIYTGSGSTWTLNKRIIDPTTYAEVAANPINIPASQFSGTGGNTFLILHASDTHLFMGQRFVVDVVADTFRIGRVYIFNIVTGALISTVISPISYTARDVNGRFEYAIGNNGAYSPVNQRLYLGWSIQDSSSFTVYDATKENLYVIANPITLPTFVDSVNAVEVSNGDTFTDFARESISLNDTHVFVSADRQTIGSASRVGAVYVFRLTDTGFVQQLTHDAALSFTDFGEPLLGFPGYVAVRAYPNDRADISIFKLNTVTGQYVLDARIARVLFDLNLDEYDIVLDGTNLFSVGEDLGSAVIRQYPPVIAVSELLPVVKKKTILRVR